jgi:pseudomonalisin
MAISRRALCGALLFVATAAAGRSATVPGGGSGALDDADRVVLPGNVPAAARSAVDLGRSDPNLPLERMIFLLELRPGAEARLQQLLAEQQEPAAPRFHRWLTPAEFGAEFGLRDADLGVVTGWLTAHGFTVDEVAPGRGWIDFSGTVAQVERAFATEMHDYASDGAIRHANAIDPSLPRGLTGLVHGIVSLNSFPLRPLHTSPLPLPAADPAFTSGARHFLAPADFATIYGLNPAYAAGASGAGQTIAITGRTDINLSDVTTFRNFFGLPINNPVFIHNGTDPGNLGGGEETEADLDTQWSGAVAPEATVKLVISASTRTTDGVALSAQYVVSHNLAPVMSTSFSLCESKMGPSGLKFYNALWAQAAAQGISSFIASGDSGAAGCDAASGPRGFGTGVNGICSGPNDVCVGGTQFADTANPAAYWTASNHFLTEGSALSYIPEIGWNESAGVPGGSGLFASGGGASTVYPKPSWQSAPGVPADRKRDIPDVSLAAAGHDGYLFFQDGKLFAVGGTSAASPSFAGLMALVVAATHARQGNPNPILYRLATGQLRHTGPAVFHDITSGNNNVPRVRGFACGTGYDQVTGLGSVNGAALIAFWP